MTNIQFALNTTASPQDEFLISIHMIIFYILVSGWNFIPAKTDEIMLGRNFTFAKTFEYNENFDQRQG